MAYSGDPDRPYAPEVPDFPHLPGNVAHAIAEFDRKVNTPELPLAPDGHPVIPPADEAWISDFLHSHIVTEI